MGDFGTYYDPSPSWGWGGQYDPGGFDPGPAYDPGPYDPGPYDPGPYSDPGTSYNPYTGTDPYTNPFGGGNITGPLWGIDPYSAPTPGGGNWLSSLLGAGGGGLMSLLSSPGVLAALGGAGGLASLLGNVAAGGRGPAYTNQGSGSQTGTTSNTTNNTSAYGITPTMMPEATAAGNYAQQALQAMGPGAMSLYNQGVGGLGGIFNAAAGGQMPFQQGVGNIINALGQGSPFQGTVGNIIGQLGQQGGGAPFQSQLSGVLSQLTGGGAPYVGGFPTTVGEPTPEMTNLVNKAFDPYMQTLASDAINSAREAGFAGGADLLGTAASPLAAKALAQVPGMKADRTLQMMLQLPQIQGDLAAKAAAANANAAQVRQQGLIGAGGLMNAAGGNTIQALLGAGGLANNAGANSIQALLGAGGLANTAQGQQFSTLLNAAQSMMNPMLAYTQGQTNLLNAYPRGTTGYGTSSGAGTGTSSSNSNFGNTGQGTNPMGNVVGGGIGQILAGMGGGIQAAGMNQFIQDYIRSRMSGSAGLGLNS